jgi:hypothetical protein
MASSNGRIDGFQPTDWQPHHFCRDCGVFVGCGGPRRLERSDTHRAVAQPPNFIGLPQIAVMGIASLNAILRDCAILRVGSRRAFVGWVEHSDTHRPVAQSPGFIGLPQIVVMGIASLNAILRGPRYPAGWQSQGFCRMWLSVAIPIKRLRSRRIYWFVAGRGDGYRFAQRYSMGIASLNAILRARTILRGPDYPTNQARQTAGSFR